MPTLSELQALGQPQLVSEDRAALLATLIANMERELPDWDGQHAFAPIYRAEVVLATRWLELASDYNVAFGDAYISFASGHGLDLKAGERGVFREPGESDADLRARALERPLVVPHLLFRDEIARVARAANPTAVADVDPVLRPDHRTWDVWIRSAEPPVGNLLPGIPSGGLVAQVQLALDSADDFAPVVGVHYAATAVTVSAYLVVGSIQYPADKYDGSSLVTRATRAIYAYAALQSYIGAPIYRDAIEAALQIEDDITTTLTTPAADIAGVAGTVQYLAPTGLTLTATAMP